MDFLLVHGSTQSPLAWTRLVAALERRGHRALAVDLPTGRPEFVLADYAALAAEQAATLDSPLVVAHSLGGLLLPSVATAVGAPHLVWLGALVPDADGGRPPRAEIAADRLEMFGPEWQTWAEDVTEAPAVSAYFLFHDCDLETLRWALATLRLFLPQAVLDEVPAPRPTAPSTYVVPAEDRTLRPGWMRTAARERLGATVVEVPGGHCPHVSRPDRIAELLDGLG